MWLRESLLSFRGTTSGRCKGKTPMQLQVEQTGSARRYSTALSHSLFWNSTGLQCNLNKRKEKKGGPTVCRHIILSNDDSSHSVEELKPGIWGGERALWHFDLIESLIYCSQNCSARILKQPGTRAFLQGKVSQSGKSLHLAPKTGYWESFVLKCVFLYLHTEILKISSLWQNAIWLNIKR